MSKRTLIVFSGGGAPGIDIHAGIARALEMHEVVPTEIHGTSAGAIFGALWAANHFDGIAASAIVHALTDRDFRDFRFLWRLRSAMGWTESIMAGQKAAALADKLLPPSFSDLPCRFVCHTVEHGTQQLVAHDSGDLRRAVVASMSIRGVFPAVQIGSYRYSDGGTKANVPLPPHWRDFDRVFICIATQPVDYPKNNGAIYNAMFSIHELMEGQVARVLRDVEPEIGRKVIVIRPGVDTTGSALRFDHNLIRVAQLDARKTLENHHVHG